MNYFASQFDYAENPGSITIKILLDWLNKTGEQGTNWLKIV